MTRPAADERDPQPATPWTEHSHAGVRRLALDACRQAVEAAKDRRKKPTTEETPDE